MSLEAKDISNSVVIGGSNSGNVENHVHNEFNADSSIDMQKLAIELAQLRSAMLQESHSAEDFIRLGKVAEAEEMAKSNNYVGILERLKDVGQWTLDVATKIGVGLAVEVIKRAAGI